MIRRFERTRRKKAEFWEISITARVITVRAGRSPSDATTTTETCATVAAAKKELARRVAEQVEAGFVEVAATVAAAGTEEVAQNDAKKAAPPKSSPAKKAAKASATLVVAAPAGVFKAARVGDTVTIAWIAPGEIALRTAKDGDAPSPPHRHSMFGGTKDLAWIAEESLEGAPVEPTAEQIAGLPFAAADAGWLQAEPPNVSSADPGGARYDDVAMPDKPGVVAAASGCPPLGANAAPASGAGGHVVHGSGYSLQGLDARALRPLWTTSIGSDAAGRMALAGDRVFVPLGDQLDAFDVSTGMGRWKASVKKGTTPVVVDGWLYIGHTPKGGQYELVSLHTGTGKTRWRAPLALEPQGVVVDAGRVYCRTQRGDERSLTVFGASDGRSLWQCAGVDGAAAADGAVVVYGGGLVRCLDGATGAVRWSCDEPETSNSEGRAIAAGLVLSVGKTSGEVTARSLADGRVAWRQPATAESNGKTYGGSALRGFRDVVVVHNFHRHTGLDARTGEPRWTLMDGELGWADEVPLSVDWQSVGVVDGFLVLWLRTKDSGYTPVRVAPGAPAVGRPWSPPADDAILALVRARDRAGLEAAFAANPHWSTAALDDSGLRALALVLNRTSEGAWALDFMLKAGADPHVADADGKQPIHTAARSLGLVSLECVERLLAAGARVDAKARGGDTPLHLARHVDVVTALVKAGASLEATDNDGATALEALEGRNPMLAIAAKVAAGRSVPAADAAWTVEVVQKALSAVVSLFPPSNVPPQVPNFKRMKGLTVSAQRPDFLGAHAKGLLSATPVQLEWSENDQRFWGPLLVPGVKPHERPVAEITDEGTFEIVAASLRDWLDRQLADTALADLERVRGAVGLERHDPEAFERRRDAARTRFASHMTPT